MKYYGICGLFKMLEKVNRTHCLPDSGMNAKVLFKENITVVLNNGKKTRVKING